MISKSKHNNIQEERLNKLMIILFLITGFSIYILCEPVRTIVWKSSFNESFNVLFIFSSVLLILILITKKQVYIAPLVFTLIFSGIGLIDLIYSKSNYVHVLVIISTMILPFLLTGIKVPENIFEKGFRIFLITYNVILFIIISIGIADYLSNASIQLFLGKHLFSEEMNKIIMVEHNTGIYRYYSFLGHPLVSTWYILLFFTLNFLNNRIFKPVVNFMVVSLVTLIGLVICGSKTGLAVGLVMILMFNNIKKRKALYYISLVISSVLIFFSPMFQQNLLQRYIIGIHDKDFGEGRTKALETVIQGWVDPPHWIFGGGIGYSREIIKKIGGYITNFEYPIIMFMYDFSVIGTIVIYILIYFVPLFYLIKYKDYAGAVLFSLLFAYLNGFNALANYSDYVGQFAFFIILAIHLSKLNSEKIKAQITCR